MMGGATPAAGEGRLTEMTCRLHQNTLAFSRRCQRARQLMGPLVDGGYVAFSGGKDSTVLAHMANELRPGIPMISWMDDLEWPETQKFVEHCRDTLGWNITIVRRDGLWDCICNIGLSPFVHNYFYDRRLLPAHRRNLAGGYQCVMLGLRSEESRARRITAEIHGERFVYRTGQVRLCPLLNWSGRDVLTYIAAHNLPLHPLYGRLAGWQSADPATLRVSWWIPMPATARHGYMAWLKRHYRQQYLLLTTQFPDTRNYA